MFTLRPTRTLAGLLSLLTNLPTMSSSRAPASSLHPGSILDVALTEYKNDIGKDLLSHPLSIELQQCDSVDGILAILQQQTNALEQLRDRNRELTKWVSSSVNILCSISAILSDGVSLVRLRTRFCDY